MPEGKTPTIEKNEKIINIVERILYFNQLEQQEGSGLKILTPNQMISRLPISLFFVQIKKTYKATL